ncbi:MAG: hypothetical protein OCC45_07680 [Desulfotalea sp.]
MNLKFRYATYLLLVMVFLFLTSWLAVNLLTAGYYWYLAILTISIYFIMYFLGRSMVGIFLLLSLFNHIKKSGGSLSVEDCERFVATTLIKKSAEERRILFDNAVGKMIEAGIVVRIEKSLVVVSI